MRKPDALLAVLPHSQCGACGQAGCAPFARALVEGAAQVQDCAPGGSLVRARLERRLGTSTLPAVVDALAPLPEPVRARIDPEECIGCAKCLDACPVDAILGASRQLHVVVGEDCTGCGLCLPPCPVDCIELLPTAPAGWPRADSDAARRVTGSSHADCVACGACQPACPET
ncbi:MAG: RnfABCDGE type electron transport complex subunit B, partial [Gammaproteobacteria bacterium]|nr:RnfABCDGE type electron transport complex subunit B [Gammaproteobacteria bacterium]